MNKRGPRGKRGRTGPPGMCGPMGMRGEPGLVLSKEQIAEIMAMALEAHPLEATRRTSAIWIWIAVLAVLAYAMLLIRVL